MIESFLKYLTERNPDKLGDLDNVNVLEYKSTLKKVQRKYRYPRYLIPP